MANQYTMRLLIQASLGKADLLRTNAVTGLVEPVDSMDLTDVGLWINLELATLWDILINSSEDYCIKHHTINVVAGIENYSLPDDFYKFRKVFPVSSGIRSPALRKFHLKDLGQADSLAALLTSPIDETRYRITGNRLWLHPEPTNAAELELWYVPQFDILVNVDDLIDFRFPVGWEQYVIEGVAAAALEKENLDSAPFRANQQKALQRILVMVEDRDVGEPHQMQDTEGYLDVY